MGKVNNHSMLRRAIMSFLRFRFPGRVYAVAIRGGIGTAPGTPDILVCINGRFVGIEIKTGAGRMSDMQKEAFRQINAAGGQAVTIHNLEEAIEAFKNYE